MKISYKVIASCIMILALQFASSVNAQNPTNATQNFTCVANTSGAIKSPIDITPITCANIAVFNINFTSATATVNFNQTWLNFQWEPTTSAGLPAGFGSLGAVADDYGIDNYTAQWLQFKTPSEHSIRGVKAPLEVQIYFMSLNSTRQNAMFSFLIYRSRPPGQAYTTNLISNYFNDVDFSGINPTTINLSDLANRVNTYPQFYRYPGTTIQNNCVNITWYVYSSNVYVANGTIIGNFRSSIANYASAHSSLLTLNSTIDPYDNVTVMSNAAPQTPPVWVNADLIERFCYKEFWRNHIPFNYGLWFALGMLVLFFCCQLCTNTNKPIRDPDYKETPLTIHPIYSLAKVSNEIFTRRTRFTVLWMNLTNNAIITSIFAANNKKIAGNNNGIVGADFFTYALAGSVCGGTFTYIWGFLLRRFYISKHRLLTEKNKGEQSDATKVEKHEEDANFYVYFFYFITFAWMWGGNLIFVWQMNQINPIDRIGVPGMQNLEMSVRWVATFFISVGLDWFVLDVINVILSFILPFWRSIVKWKGYMYDRICHETWLIYSKED